MSEETTVRHKHSRRPSSARTFWLNYRVELVGLIAVGAGIFLLVEQLNIRRSAAVWFRGFVASALVRFQQLDHEIGQLLTRVSLSDFIGAVLIICAVVAVLLRLRWRLMNSPQLTSGDCPKCHGAIHRVHRRWTDRLICLYVPVRRYGCHNSECRWRGLKVGRHHGSTVRRAASSG